MNRIRVQNLPQPERVQTYPWYFTARKEGILMNINYSTTEANASERIIDLRLSTQWEIINWEKVERQVNGLQVRIAKATINKKWNDVKRFQYLLTHSYYAKLLAVKKVTTNKGKNTPGVDGELWLTSASKMKAVRKLTDKGYKAQPLRRVYIKKDGKKEKRPLGIPTMYDRAMQALYALALDPVSESTADTKSFGFRPYRGAHDACGQLFCALAKKHSAKWILEGDIKGCFDNISHDWLIDNIPMDKSILKQFLKSGFVFKGELFPTDDGTPQGGVISPILANMALDGLQKAIEKKFHHGKSGRSTRYTRDKNKVNFVRYADDFVVTTATPELAQEAKTVVAEFLATRGLELSEEKTLITHIDNGFDFLGWTFRKFNEKLIIRPSKKSINKLIRNLSDTVLKKGKAWSQELLILKLNQQLRGWANYHQPICAKATFSYIDHTLFLILWKWAKHRHPKKGKRWIKERYWHVKGSRKWVFSTPIAPLIRITDTPIIRHITIQHETNPYIHTEYLAKRKFSLGVSKLTGKFKSAWIKQKGLCFHCGNPMEINNNRDVFYIKAPTSEDPHTTENMVYIHKSCKHNI